MYIPQRLAALAFGLSFIRDILVVNRNKFQVGFGLKFRPVSVSVFQFSPVSAETLFLAEIACFGLVSVSLIWIGSTFQLKKTMAEQYLSAEIRYFGQNRLFQPKKCIGRNFGFLQAPCFGVSAEKLFRLTTRTFNKGR